MQFARWSREQEQMRPLLWRVRGQIKAGGAAVFVRQDGCAGRYVRLSRHPVGQTEPASSRSLLNRSQDCRIMVQFQAKQIGRDLAGNVVGGGPEAPGYKNEVRLVERSGDGVPDRVSIGDRDLAFDPQAERENFPRDKG